MFGISCTGQGSDINEIKFLYCTCKKNVKKRYNNHAASFRNINREKTTELPKYVWELRNNSINYDSVIVFYIFYICIYIYIYIYIYIQCIYKVCIYNVYMYIYLSKNRQRKYNLFSTQSFMLPKFS